MLEVRKMYDKVKKENKTVMTGFSYYNSVY